MKDIFNSILKEYENDRKNAENYAEEKYAKAKLIDYFCQIEKQIKEIDFLLGKAKQFDNDEEQAEILTKRKATLLITRKKILEKNGLNEQDFIPKYKCNTCSDTGFLNGRPCKCFTEKMKKVVLNTLDLSPIPNVTFKDAYGDGGERLKKIYSKMQEYVSSFPNTHTKNFVFCGKCGSGKTYLAQIMANEIQNAGYSTVFLTATDLNERFIKMHFTPYNERTDYMTALINCDFLVIDDLGTEPIYNKITIEYLLALVSERLQKLKNTVITTNLHQNELLSRYSERFFSRITEKKHSAFVTFEDNNFRANK